MCPGPRKEGDGCGTELPRGRTRAPRRAWRAPVLRAASGRVRVVLLKMAKVIDPVAMATHPLGSRTGEADHGILE